VALDGGGICERAQEFAGGVLLAGEAEVGADLGEWLKYEAAQVETRMGDDDGRRRKGEIPDVEDVEVNGARRVARAF